MDEKKNVDEADSPAPDKSVWVAERLAWLEREMWADIKGISAPTKQEREEILGYGPNGV
jgi:hypothetical protein